MEIIITLVVWYVMGFISCVLILILAQNEKIRFNKEMRVKYIDYFAPEYFPLTKEFTVGDLIFCLIFGLAGIFLTVILIISLIVYFFTSGIGKKIGKKIKKFFDYKLWESHEE